MPRIPAYRNPSGTGAYKPQKKTARPKPKPRTPQYGPTPERVRAERRERQTGQVITPRARRIVGPPTAKDREAIRRQRAASTPQARADRELDAILRSRADARRARARRGPAISASGFPIVPADPDWQRRAADANEGGFLDPVGHFLSPVLDVLEAPSYMAGNLIRDPSGEGYLRGTRGVARGVGVNRIPGVEVGSEADKVLPSQALRERGWLPGGWGGAALGVLADVGLNPASYPTGAGAGAAAATRAGVKASRARMLRETARQVPREQTLARPQAPPGPRRPRGPADRPATVEPGVSGRRGPDVSPQSIRRAQARRRTQERAAVRRRRGVADLPYPPSAGAQRAVELHRRAVAGRARTQRTYIPATQAAGAGARATLSGQRVRAVEQEVLTAGARRGSQLPRLRTERRSLANRLAEARKNGNGSAARTLAAQLARKDEQIKRTAALARMEPERTTASRTAGGATYASGVTATGRRPASIYQPMTGRAPTPPARRAAKPHPQVEPRKVPYSPVHDAERVLAEAEDAVRSVATARKVTPVQLTEAGRALGRAEAALPKPGGKYGISAKTSQAYSRFLNRMQRVVELRRAAAGNPAREREVAEAIREAGAARVAYRQAVVRERQRIAAGQRHAAARRTSASVRPQATDQQVRTARRMLTGPGSEPFGPAARAAKGSPITPMVARKLPMLRERHARNQRILDRVFEERPPTPRQAAAAGERFKVAEARLRDVRRKVYRAARPPKPKRPEATTEQRLKYRETFTGSRVRELLDAEMDVTTAMEKGRRSANMGLHIYLPGMAPTGRSIPILRIPGTATYRSAKSTSLPGGEAAEAGRFDQLAADWRDVMVSQFGPNRIVGDGALAAENFVNYSRGRLVERVIARSRPLSHEERKLASHYREGTVPKGVDVPQHVRDYADEMGRLTDEMLDEYLRAGGDVTRLRREYVYHAFDPKDADNAIAALSHIKWGSDRYANTPGFARKRAFPTIQQAKDAGLEPIEDLAELTVLRASAHYRALAQMELARSVARRFGRRQDDIPGITPGMSAAQRNKVLGRWVNLNEVVGGQVKGASDLYVPADVAGTLKNAAEIPRRMVARNSFTKATRRFNRSWKQLALLTSGYHIRNQMSDMILVAQAGQDPFSALYRGLRLMGKPTRKSKSVPAKSIGRGRSAYTRGEQAELSDMLGVSGHGMVAKDVGEDLGPTMSRARRAPRGYQKFSAGRENVMRRGSVSGLMDRMGPVMAARHTRRNVYDYADVGRAVDLARKQPIAPFVTWPVKNIPRQLAHLVQRPRSFIAADAINQALYEQGGAPSALPMPDYMRERAPTYIPGFGWASYDNPMADLNMVPGATSRPLEKVARSYAGLLSPLVQLPFAAATSQAPATGIEFRDRQPATDLDVALSRIPGLRELLQPDVTLQTDASGRKVPVESVRGFPSWFAAAFTPGASQTNRFGLAEQIAPRTIGEASRGDWYDEFGAQLLGVRRTDPKNLRAIRGAIGTREWEQRELAIELNAKAKARRAAGKPANKREFPEWARLERLKVELRELRRLEREARAAATR